MTDTKPRFTEEDFVVTDEMLKSRPIITEEDMPEGDWETSEEWRKMTIDSE